MDAREYEDGFNKDELVAEAGSRGLPTTGTKADLAEALAASDAEQDERESAGPVEQVDAQPGEGDVLVEETLTEPAYAPTGHTVVTPVAGSELPADHPTQFLVEN